MACKSATPVGEIILDLGAFSEGCFTLGVSAGSLGSMYNSSKASLRLRGGIEASEDRQVVMTSRTAVVSSAVRVMDGKGLEESARMITGERDVFFC